MPEGNRIANELNAGCFCVTLNRAALLSFLEREAPGPDVSDVWHRLPQSHPHLFAESPAYVSRASIAGMMSAVAAIERVAALPLWREAVLADAQAIAGHDHGPHGAFMGYDFHVTPEGPKLIEINTNAGGAFLNDALRRAQIACCDEVKDALALDQPSDFGANVARMFEQEFGAQFPSRTLKTIAIMDEMPEQQYLWPEFLLAKAMLERQGIRCVIAAPQDLSLADGRLMLGQTPIDLVYNRLVDFAFDKPTHAILRQAYEQDLAAITPNPHNHALLANKRNLVRLSDSAELKRMGASDADIAALSVVPETLVVAPDNATRLWTDRKHYFFKPLAGHGGKAVYRGDKVTTSVWKDITSHPYVAQRLVPPGERNVKVDGTPTPRKMDIRLYTYDGQLLMAAARLYQGQTTNFRTPGGGFAPLYIV